MTNIRRVQRTPEQYARIRQSRQILAGDAVRPTPDPWARTDSRLPFTALQRNALFLMLALLVLGGVLALFGQILLASIPFFLLALLLIVSRFLF